jgi:hypothetical protein
VDAENFRSYVDALESKLAKQLDLHMNVIADHLGKMHEAATQGREHAQDANQAALDRQHELNMAQLGHQQALEQGQQAAALAPTPDQGNA